MKMTERDKKLLILAGAAFFAFELTVLVFWPLTDSIWRMKKQADKNDILIAQMKMKEEKLAGLRAVNQEKKKKVARLQSEIFPMLESQDIDQFLTDKAVHYGLNVYSLKISMPDQPEIVPAYGQTEGDGDGREEGIYIVYVDMTIFGLPEDMEPWIDDISGTDSNIRIVALKRGSERRTNADGQVRFSPVTTVGLEIYMCREDAK